MNNYLDIGSKVLSILVGGFALFIGVKYSGLEKTVQLTNEKLNVSINQMNKTQDSLEFGRKHRFAIYDKVYSALEDNNKRKAELATVLVFEMLVNDPFQIPLLTVIRSEPDLLSAATLAKIDKLIAEIDSSKKFEEIKTIQIEKFENTAEKGIGKGKKDFLVDVFYLESKGQKQKETAIKFEKMLTKDGFDARVRKLSDLVNARQGYKIYTNQIRVEASNNLEIELGEKIKKVLGDSLTLRQVSQSSPGYISVFLVE